MKKFIVSVIAGSLFLFFYISKVSADETSEAILKILIKKGIITCSAPHLSSENLLSF